MVNLFIIIQNILRHGLWLRDNGIKIISYTALYYYVNFFFKQFSII